MAPTKTAPDNWVLDLKAPYTPLGDDPKNADFVLQGDAIYGWSESNMRYEFAWWLYDLTPDNPLRQAVRKERPLKI
jgi:hypothetical protein